MAKVLVCLGEGLSEQQEFQKTSEELQDKGFEVHLFDNVNELELMPHMVFDVLEHVWKENIDDNEYYFLSNIKDFFLLSYRVLQHTFKDFIFWQDDLSAAYFSDYSDIYAALLEKEIDAKENLTKPIYVHGSTDFNNDFYNNLAQAFAAERFCMAEDGDDCVSQQNIYCLQGQCYLLEASYGEVEYIYLDEVKIEETQFKDFVIPIELDEKMVQQIEEMFEFISRDMLTILRREEILHKLFVYARAALLVKSQKEQKYYQSLLLAMSSSYGIYAEVFILSFFLQLYTTSLFYKTLLQKIFLSGDLNVQQKYFALSQANYVELKDYGQHKDELLCWEAKLYKQICAEFKKISKANEFEPSTDSDKDSVVIFTSQFLNTQHTPTLYSLEIAKYLVEKRNKKVCIINTCEHLTQVGKIPFFDTLAASIQSGYSKDNAINYEGANIGFVQMISSMPTIGGIDGIMEYIEEIKPSLVINISDLSVIGGICAEFISNLSIPVENKMFVPIKGMLLNAQILSASARQTYDDGGVTLIDCEALNGADEQKDEAFFVNLLENAADKLSL